MEAYDWFILPVVNPDGYAYSMAGVTIMQCTLWIYMSVVSYCFYCFHFSNWHLRSDFSTGCGELHDHNIRDLTADVTAAMPIGTLIINGTVSVHAETKGVQGKGREYVTITAA